MRRYACQNLRLEEDSIQVHPMSGLNPGDKINLIQEADARIGQILQALPPLDVAVLILGSNDLCFYLDRSPATIANQLIDLGQTLLCRGVKRVAFAACLPRFGWGAFKHMCTLDQGDDVWTLDDLEYCFNERVRAFNGYLIERVCEVQDFDFITMRGLRQDIFEKLYDGLHLGFDGQNTLLRTLRREIIYNCRKARGGRIGFGRRKRRRQNRRRHSQAQYYRRSSFRRWARR